jgi:hypothetical protein
MQIEFAEEPGLSAIDYLELWTRAIMPTDASRDAAQAALARTIKAGMWVIPDHGREEEQEKALREHKFGITPNRPWIGFKGRRRRVHDPDWAWRTRDQEPWDYDRFLEMYNAIAKMRGGWVFEADGRTPDVLEERYHSYPQHYPDLSTFAEALLISDQRVA